jgi:flavin-dependent dehydrogenase
MVVVGGGPAGCAAALTVLRHTDLTVLVVERSGYDAYRVGETLPPGAGPLLAYLGIADVVTDHLPAPATAAAWGDDRVVTRDFLFTGRGHGWHLDRRRFDAALADAVTAAGGTVATATTADVTDRDGALWSVRLRNRTGVTRTVRTAMLVDATGRTATLARRLGAVRIAVDSLMGVVQILDAPQPVPGPPTTLVESTPEGWWYTAPLPDGRLVAAFMTDAPTVRRDRLKSGAIPGRHLAAARHTSERLDGCRPAGAPLVRSAHSQYLTLVAGEAWVAVGDAAAAFDPLASMGIGYALASGAAGARALHAQFAGQPEEIEEYASSVVDHTRDFLTLRHRHYTAERRWPDQPFWAARHQLPSSPPERITPPPSAR